MRRRLSIDTKTLSSFERGKHLPSLATLERLVSILMTTIAELLDKTPLLPDDNHYVLITSPKSRGPCIHKTCG